MQIDKHIPIPADADRSGLRGTGKYPHCLLEVGDSYFMEKMGHARTIAWKHAYATGKRFIFRKDGTGYRCWRVK